MSKNTLIDSVFIGSSVMALFMIHRGEYSWWWMLTIAGLYGVITILGTLNLDWSYFITVRSNGIKWDNRIALTFDDGPLDHYTPAILKILAEHQIHATFFCVGHRIEKRPDLVIEMDRGGHIVANHTYTHKPTFPLQRTQSIIQELNGTNLRILKAIGKRSRLFRPPYGITHPFIANAVLQTNHVVVGWSIRSYDTVIKNPEVLLARIMKRVKGGDIILLHDYSEAMVLILPRLISSLKSKGYTFVTVDDLIDEHAYA
jgi:peptidoglycan/xylan/chitin deacetylase (PgdA/CDA1 family)